MQLSRFLPVICLALVWGVSDFAAAQSMGAPPPPAKEDKEKKKAKKDPVLTGAFAPIPLDEETKAALVRGKEPGVLVSDQAKKGYVSLIRIQGAKKVDVDAMIAQLKTHINRPFDKELVREDIRRLYAVGIFSDITVESGVGLNDSIELSYKLKEKPTIFKVKFEGNESVFENDLEGAIDIERFHVADNVRIKENSEKLRKLYVEKGFYLSTITYRLEPASAEELQERESTQKVGEEKKVRIATAPLTGPDYMNLVYVIDEGNKVRIEQISFKGNARYTDEELKNVIFSRENHPLGAIYGWGTFNEEMNEGDAYMLDKFYQDHGYVNVLVGKPRVSISSDKTRISILFPITEGEQFRLGKLDIKGDFVVDEIDASKVKEGADPQFKKSTLLQRVTQATGDVFNRSQLHNELLAIGNVYQNEGYAYANVGPQVQVNDATKTVDVTLNIDAGPRVEIERIDFTGNFRTANEVARREMRLYEGELYSSSMLKLSEINLNRSGFFEKVKVTTKEGSAKDKMIVEVELEERKTGQFTIGGGYGTGGEGILFQSSVQQNNLFGRGQTLIASVQWSGYRRIFDLRFLDPYFFYLSDQPVTLSLAAFNTYRFLGDFNRNSTGGELTLGYPIGNPLIGYSRSWLRDARPWALPFIPDFDNLRLYLSYGVERVEINDVATGVSLYGLHANQPRYTTAFKPTLQFDQRNDRMFPTAGYLVEARAEVASLALGSLGLVALEKSFNTNPAAGGIYSGNYFLKPEPATNDYFRFGMNARFYYNWDSWFFLSGWVARLNLDVGYIKPFNEPLMSENYRMGGVEVGSLTGLRGYKLNTIGPVLTVGHDRESDPLRYFTVGGNKQVLLNLEIEFPLLKSMRLTGVIFFDMGNVYGPSENFFYLGGTRNPLYTSNFSDPFGTFYGLGLFSSVGFGLRWFSPMAPLRFDFGFPLVRRPTNTPGIFGGDQSLEVGFNIGQSF